MEAHREFIKQLGGGTVIAAELSELAGESIDREAVYKWAENGVPWRWRPYLQILANRKGVDLPSGFLPGISNDIQETRDEPPEAA